MNLNRAFFLLSVCCLLLAVFFSWPKFFPKQKSSNSKPTPNPLSTNNKKLPLSPTSSNPNLKRYTSQNLGITFTYLKTQEQVTVSVLEKDNRIYVYFDSMQPSAGQSLEVFYKNKNLNLIDAVKQRFLRGYSEENCLVKANKDPNYPSSYFAVSIQTPLTEDDDMASLSAKWEKCPKDYTTTNGISYFLTDNKHPSKYVYINIGQYAIYSENNKLWSDTIQFF